MHRLILLALTIFFTLPLLGSWNVGDATDGAGGQLAACRAGAKGGGYSTDTGEYDWTCGNYNWSAEVGGRRTDLAGADGRSWYTDPTTIGGNSWILTCTGDGTGNGPVATDPAEAVNCLHAGEEIRMYSTADFMLALDNTRRGGKVYVPDGLYHHGYCGQDDEGNPNGCPVLKRNSDRTGPIRKLTAINGVEFVGGGMDVDGAFNGGRTGTWIIAQTCSDDDGNGVLSSAECEDTNGETDWNPAHGGISVGRVGTLSCALETNYGFNELCGPGGEINNNLSYAPIADYTMPSSGIAIRDVDMNHQSFVVRACVENVIANGGVCSGDQRIRCTSTATGAAARTGPNSGGCDIDLDNSGGIDDLGIGVAFNERFGTCEGWADGITTRIANQEPQGSLGDGAHGLFSTLPYQHKGDSLSQAGQGQHNSYAHIGNVTATACDTDGVYVDFRSDESAFGFLWPSPQGKIDAGVLSPTLTISSYALMDNYNAGFSQMNFILASSFVVTQRVRMVLPTASKQTSARAQAPQPTATK